MHPARRLNLRLVYRARQFWHALRAQPARRDLAQVRETLGSSAMALFVQMQPSEQAHSFQVYQKLRDAGETHPDLLSAALLHDAGKRLYPLRPFDRVLVVLAKAFFPARARRWGAVNANSENGDSRMLNAMHSWRRPFIISEQHAEWGARLAEQAGVSPLAVTLIRRHQEEITDSAVTFQSEPGILIFAQNDELDCHPERSEGSHTREEEALIHLLRILQSADDES